MKAKEERERNQTQNKCVYLLISCVYGTVDTALESNKFQREIFRDRTGGMGIRVVGCTTHKFQIAFENSALKNKFGLSN